MTATLTTEHTFPAQTSHTSDAIVYDTNGEPEVAPVNDDEYPHEL
jgi:hypothetical protein